MAILIFVLAYSSVIAVCRPIPDTNMSFVFGDARWATWTVRVVCASATIGALAEPRRRGTPSTSRWSVMTITNLVALIVFLSRWVLARL